MHLSEVLTWIESHPGQPMVHGAKVPKPGSAKAKESAKEAEGKEQQKQATQQAAAEKNKQFAQQQLDYAKKYNTQAYRAQTSEAGGTYVNKAGQVVTVLSKEQAIRQATQRAVEANRKIREYEKLPESEKQKLREKGAVPRAPDNEPVGNRLDVYYRDIDDQARVREQFTQRVKETFGSQETTQQRTGTAYTIELQESLRLSDVKPYQKTRQKFAREYAEEMTRGESPLGFIGEKSREAIQQEETSFLEQGFAEKEVFPITYVDESGKELVTITGKSPGSEYSIYGPGKPFLPEGFAPIGPAGLGLAIPTTKKDYRVFPVFGPPTKPEQQGPPTKNIVQQAEEKSPLYNLIGEYGKGSRESLKGYLKQGYHIGAEIGLMFVPPEISGIDDPKKREELRRAIDKPYPKELQPKETPLTNLLAGVSPITPYGLKYDIGATATDIFLLGSGIPKIEKLAQVPALIKKIPGAIKEAPEAIKSFLKRDALIEEAISTRVPPPIELVPYGKLPLRRTIPKDIFKDDIEKISINLGRTEVGAIGVTKRIQTDIGSYQVVVPTSKLPIVIGKKAPPPAGPIELDPFYIRSPITSKALPKATSFEEGSIGLGRTSNIGVTKRIQTDIGSYQVVVPTSKLPIVIGKKAPPPAGPIELDPFYIRSPITGKGNIIPKGIEKSKQFWSTKKSLGVGITRRISSGESKPTLKRYPKKPTKPDVGTEEKISNALVLLMKDPKLKPFTETKIPLGVSDKTRLVREGKVIHDTITKPKPSPKSFFSYPGAPVKPSGYTSPIIRYPSGTNIEKITQIVIPPLFATETIEAQDTDIFYKPKSDSLILQKIKTPTTQEERHKLILDIGIKTGIAEKPRISETSIIGLELITITEPKQTQKQTPRIAERYPTKSPTRLFPLTSQPFREKEKQLEILKEIPPKEPPPKIRKIFIDLPKERPKKRKEPKELKSAFSWKGNVPEFQIEGVYKKYDIIYGEKKIAKLLKEERFGKPKRKAKKQYDILGFPKTKKAKSSKWAF